MKRRALLRGLLVAAVPLPAWAKPAPRWHSISKQRVGRDIVYQRPEPALLLPVPDDVPDYRHVALKLTGGPLSLRQVVYLYPRGRHEAHRLDVDMRSSEILPLPEPNERPLAVNVVGELFADGHRYWHLVGTNDPV